MAPKRQLKKVIGTVLRSTRKIVKETVEVAVIAATESQLMQESPQEDQNFVETEDIDVPIEEPVTTIPVRGKVRAQAQEGGGGETIEVPVEEPKADAAADGVRAQQELPREAEGKEKQTIEVPAEEREPSKEEERREDHQTSDLSQEDAVLKEESLRGASTSRAGCQEAASRKGEEEPRPERDEVTEREKRTRDGKVGGKKRRRKRRTVGAGHGYRRYVFRVLKQVHPQMRVSSMAMDVINSLMNDIFERIADEAAKLSRYRERTTLSSWEIQGAVKLVLPGDLGKHAIAEGAKAVANYLSYDGKRNA